MKCVYCGRAKVSRPRGLCWTCYYTPGVLAIVPVSSHPTARRGVGSALPHSMPEPTTALPGTPDKLAVLAARAAAGQHLWHQDDPRIIHQGVAKNRSLDLAKKVHAAKSLVHFLQGEA